ncbi:uncharacterized protein [Apostichopus japonicus]|uniref:uncharacterized protein isoform X1 n=1 Tax=Stichopus japonicus TaxID=307972 RepID=UPI003AB2FEFD
MVKIGPFLLISLWLTSCAIRGSNVPNCVVTSDNIQPVQTTVCKGLYYEPVCLVCGDKGSHVKWLFGETLVAQNGINFGHVDSVDKCDDKIPSIGLASCYQAMSYLISCKLENRKTILATFTVECIGPEMLIMERNNLEYLVDNLTLVNPSNEINLVCDFRQVLPPVSLQWFVDGELLQTKRFTKKFDQPSTYSLSLAINSSQVNRSITCTSYGDRAPNMSRSIFISRRRQISESSSSSAATTVVILLAIVSLVVTPVAYKLVKREGYTAIRCTRWFYSVSSIFSSSWETGIDMESNAQHHTEVKRTGRQKRKTIGVQSLSFRNKRSMLSKEPVISVKLQSSEMFEYWNAQASDEDCTEFTCFAKVLSDQATADDYVTMRTLAKSLSTFKMDDRFVRILFMSTQETPMVFYYESMNFGTLQDHVKNRFASHAMTTNEDGQLHLEKILEALLSIALNISDAMSYLVSKKFCHPALSLRKVLLTESGSYKLYDIYPHKLCKARIKQLTRKVNPPVAWMATEIFVLEKYLLKSEAWNLSVFLWQLFSLGEYPFEGLSSAEVKAKVIEEFLLPKPEICPQDIYEIMVSSWQTNHQTRPVSAVMVQTIKSLIGRLDKEN